VRKLKIQNNRPLKMLFWRCTVITICGVRRMKGNSPKKMTETQKVVDTKKTPEPSVEKTPEKTTAEKTTAEKTTAEKTAEKNNVDAPMKKKLTILKRPSQPEVFTY
jgi:hypothetical protein